MDNYREIFKRSLVLFIGFLCFFSGIILNIYSTARFLDVVGVGKIPYVMVAVALLASLFSIFNSIVSRKVPGVKIFYIMLLPIIGLFAGVFYLSPTESFQVTALCVLSGFWYYFITIGVNNLGFSSVNMAQSKSFLPILIAFSSLGEVVGAAVLTYLAISTLKQVSTITLALLLVIALLILLCAKIFQKEFQINAKSDDSGENLNSVSIKETIAFTFKKSPVFRYLSLLVVCFIFLNIFIRYRMLSDLESKLDADSLSAMLSTAFGLQSAGIIIVNLLLARLIIFYGGVANSLVLFPMGVIVVLLINMLTGFSSVGAIGLFLAFSVSYFTFIDLAITQFFSLAPQKFSQSVYFIIRGVVGAVASFLASAMLLIYSFQIELEKFLNTFFIGIILVFAWLVAMKLRKKMNLSINSNLVGDDQYLRLQSIDLLAERAQKNKGEIELRKVILRNQFLDDATRSRAIRSIGIIGNPESIVELYTTLEEGSPKEIMASIQAVSTIISQKGVFSKIPITQHKLLQTYEKILISDLPSYIKQEIIVSLRYFEISKVIDFLEQQIKNPDVSIRINTIETIGEFSDRSIIVYLKPLLKEDDPQILGATVAALWQFPELRLNIIPIFEKILSSDQKQSIKTALRMITKINATWEEHYIQKFVKDYDPEVQLSAIIAMVSFDKNSYDSDFIEKILEYQANGMSEVVEYALALYRSLNVKVKKRILKFVLSLSADTIAVLGQVFKNSQLNFEQEANALNVG